MTGGGMLKAVRAVLQRMSRATSIAEFQANDLAQLTDQLKALGGRTLLHKCRVHLAGVMVTGLQLVARAAESGCEDCFPTQLVALVICYPDLFKTIIATEPGVAEVFSSTYASLAGSTISHSSADRATTVAHKLLWDSGTMTGSAALFPGMFKFLLAMLKQPSREAALHNDCLVLLRRCAVMLTVLVAEHRGGQLPVAGLYGVLAADEAMEALNALHGYYGLCHSKPELVDAGRQLISGSGLVECADVQRLFSFQEVGCSREDGFSLELLAAWVLLFECTLVRRSLAVVPGSEQALLTLLLGTLPSRQRLELLWGPLHLARELVDRHPGALQAHAWGVLEQLWVEHSMSAELALLLCSMLEASPSLGQQWLQQSPRAGAKMICEALSLLNHPVGMWLAAAELFGALQHSASERLFRSSSYIISNMLKQLTSKVESCGAEDWADTCATVSFVCHLVASVCCGWTRSTVLFGRQARQIASMLVLRSGILLTRVASLTPALEDMAMDRQLWHVFRRYVFCVLLDVLQQPAQQQRVCQLLHSSYQPVSTADDVGFLAFCDKLACLLEEALQSCVASLA